MKNAVRDAISMFSTKAAFGEPTSSQPVAYTTRVSKAESEFALNEATFVAFVKEAYRQNPKIFGALNLIIDTALQAPLIVVDAEAEKRGEVEELPNHRTKIVLDHVSDQHTPAQFQKKLIQHLYLGSVAFVEKVFDDDGFVTELGLLRPDKVEIHSSLKDREITHYVYTPNPNEIVPKDKIIPMRFIDPIEDYKGFSPVFALSCPIETDNQARKHVFSTLKNGGMPTVQIAIEGIGDDENQKKRIKKGYDQKTKGDNFGGSIVTDPDTTITQLGFDFKQLDISGISNITEAEILTTMKIPPTVYASLTGQIASTQDNLKTGLKMFWNHNLISLHKMIEDFLNSDPDLTEDGKVRIRYDRRNIEALQADLNELEKTWGQAWDRGYMKMNEVRAKMGLEDLGDEGNVFKPKPSSSFTMNTGSPDEQGNPEEEQEDEDEEPAKKSEAETNKKSCHFGTDRSPEECKMIELKVAMDRFRVVDNGAIEIVKLVDRELRRQIKEVQAVIGGKAGKNVKQFESNRLKNELIQLKDGWVLSFEKSDALADVYSASAKDAALQLNQQFDIESDEVINAVRAEQFKFARNVSEESAKQISAVIESAFTEGRSLGELSKDIQKLGEQWTKSRSNTIARTETAKAANRGARVGYKSAGAEFVRYSAILDSVTTEICQELDGKVVSIDAPFLTQDEGFTQSNGKQLNLSYNDGVPEAGTAHPNCRSTIIPVNEDGSLLL